VHSRGRGKDTEYSRYVGVIVMCRDSETGQFSQCSWEYGGYGTDIDVDCDGDNVHVELRLVCQECGKEAHTDCSWEVNA